MLKNIAGQEIGAQLTSKADGSPITAGTTTIYVKGQGSTQAIGSVGSGLCTHDGQGYWTYLPAQAETNYDHVAFTFVNTNGVVATVQVYTDSVWTRIMEGTYTAADLLRVLAGVAAGKTDQVQTGGVPNTPTSEALVTIRNITDTGDIVEAEMLGSKRVDVTVTP